VNDERIRQLRGEVLAQLQGAGAEPPASLEARVTALEHAVRQLAANPRAVAGAAVVVTRTDPPVHASLALLDVGGGSGQCVLEPDKPCVQSGQCRALGH